MKRTISVLIATLGILFTALIAFSPLSPKATAQNAAKKQLYGVNIRHIKPELMEEYLNFTKTRMNPLRVKGGTKTALVWIVGNGPAHTVITASPMDNFAAQDNPTGIPKALDADAAAVVFQQQGKYLSQQENYIIELLPDISWTNPKFKELPKFAILRWQKVAYGRTQEYEDYFKNYETPMRKKIVEQTNLLGQWRYRIRFGDDSSTYLMMRPFENYAELDNTKGMAEILGAAEVKKIYDQLPKGVIVSDEVWILRFRPDLSILPGTSTTEKK